MWDLQPNLAGTLVHLHPLAQAHREPLWAAAQDPRTWEWWTIRPAASRESWDAWFDRCLRAPIEEGTFHFATVLARTGEAVGSTSFCTVRQQDSGLEIGWTWLHPKVWGTEVNTDAKYLQLRYAFDTLGAIRVEWDTDAENWRSRTALAKLGAQLDGIWRDFHVRTLDDSRRSSAIFSMLDREWPAVREMLERRIAAAAAGA